MKNRIHQIGAAIAVLGILTAGAAVLALPAGAWHGLLTRTVVCVDKTETQVKYELTEPGESWNSAKADMVVLESNHPEIFAVGLHIPFGVTYSPDAVTITATQTITLKVGWVGSGETQILTTTASPVEGCHHETTTTTEPVTTTSESTTTTAEQTTTTTEPVTTTSEVTTTTQEETTTTTAEVTTTTEPETTTTEGVTTTTAGDTTTTAGDTTTTAIVTTTVPQTTTTECVPPQSSTTVPDGVVVCAVPTTVTKTPPPAGSLPVTGFSETQLMLLGLALVLLVGGITLVIVSSKSNKATA